MANTDWSKFTPEEKQTDWSQFKPEGPEAEEGPLAAIWRQGVAGAKVELPQMLGQAMQYPFEPGSKIYEAGKGIADAAAERAKLPENAPIDETKHNAVVNALAGGARMIPQSLAPALAIGGAAALAPESLAGAGLLGLASAAGAVPAALAQGQQTLEKLRSDGVPEEEAKQAARINAGIELGGETIGNFVGGRVFGAGAKALSKARVAGDVIESATAPSILKPWLKATGQAALVEPATEFGQNYGETAVENAYGAKDNPTAMESGISAIAPTLGMTALLAPFGLIGHAANANASLKRTRTLENAETDPEQRMQIANTLHQELAALDPEAATNFLNNVLPSIENNQPLKIDESVLAPPDTTGADKANADLGFAADQYDSLVPGEQKQLGYVPSVVQVPTQDGGTTTIDRSTGPLSSAAVDVINSQIQTGMPLRAYASPLEAQAALEQRPDSERMRVATHPRVDGSYAVVPKTAEALAAMDRKAEAKAKSEERLATVESEDGNASQVATTGGQGSGTVAGGSAGNSPSVGGVTGGRSDAAGASAPSRGTDTSLGDANTANAALSTASKNWDQANRTSRSNEWMTGAALSNPTMSSLAADDIPAHGMAKVATLQEGVKNLINMLTKGFDKNRTLYYDSLTNSRSGAGAASGTSGGQAYRDGPFIITFRNDLNGRQPTAADVTGVLVNPAHSELVAPLQAMFPSVVVRDYNNAADVVTASRNPSAAAQAVANEQAQSELAPAPVQPVSSMPAAERIKAERQAAARAEAQARGAQLTDDEVASANTAPTEAQQAAGNYQKGHVKIGGLDISIENPAGSTRSGKEGKKSWSVQMSDHYGYIKRTEGADGEQVDVYVKAGTATDHTGPVFVVDQYNPKTGQFDEHKAFVGYRTALDVTRAYDAHFSDGTGPKRRKGITKMAPDAFTAWARHGDTSQAADQAQLEIAQSTGKESKKRSNGDLYQAAAEANKRKQERRLPTEQNDTLAVREATGAEVSVVSEKDLPEADAAPAGHVSRQTAEFSRHVAKLFGKRVVFVEGMPADGFYNHGNTIYLSTTGSVHHLRLLGHEMLHALRSQSKETYAKLLEAVRGVVTDAQLKSQFRDYFSQDKDKKDWTNDQITEWLADDNNRDLLTEEWMADLSGNRWTESGFWEDVFTQVENKYGSEQAKGIIAKLRLALVTALNKLKTLVRGSAFAVDGRVAEHLDQIRAALATGFADYAKAVKDGQAVDRDAGGVRFARRQAAPKLTKKELKEIAEREATRIFEGKTVEQSNPLDDEQWQEVRRIALQKLKPMQRAAALKAEREYLELQKEADILSEKYKERAAQVMAKVKENGSSSVSIMDGSKPATVEGTGKMVRGKPKVLTIDIGRFFLGRQKKIDISTEEGRKAAGAAMAREAAYALTQDGHAVGWYDRKVRESLAISALVHPELLNSKKAQVVFKMIAAITSNGHAVRDNFILANIAYSNFKNGVPLESVLGEGGGARRGAMIKSLIKLRNMIEDHGAERVGEIMLMPLTVKEIQNQFGLKVSGEHMTTVLPAAVGLGGPKIGSFYANLSGHFDSLTMDMWFMRTAGRITGNIVVMPKTVGINLNELASILPESGEWNGVDVKTLRAEIDSYNKLDEDEQADVETVLETVPETIMYARAQLQKFSALDAEGKTFTQKTLQNENARRLVSALDSTNDSPGNGAERNNLRGVVDVARGLLARHGIDLNVADLQAVLWYYEKNLFTKLGANNASAKPWDYASAARFGVGRTLGLVDVKSSRRAGQVGAGEQPVAGGVSAEGQRLGEDAGQVKASPSRILFEVAPDPNDARLTSAWNSLASADKLDISKSVATRLIPKILSHFNATGQMSEQIGGYQGESNPSFTILLDSGDPDAIAKASGFVLSQDMMIAVSDKAFPGGVKTGAVTIEIGNEDPAAVYTAIYDKVKAAEGHTTVNGQMIILNNPKFGISTEELGRQVDEALGGRYNAFGDDGIYAEFPESEDYGYAIQDAQGTAAGSPDSQWARVLRAEANQQLESELRQRGVKLSTGRSYAARDGRYGSGNARTGEEVRGYGTAAPGAVTVQGTHYSKQERANLDGRYYGTGMRGAEGPRVRAATDPRLKERVYFYVDKGTGVRPEDGVGSIAHTAQLNNVYDGNADTWVQAKVGRDLSGDAWLNAFESSVIDNGFDGYVTDFGTQRAAVLLGRHNVPVTRGKGGVSEAKQAAVTAKRTDLPMGKMTGAEWKKLEPRATELEDDKSYYRDQVRFSPSRFDAIAEAFADRARKALANPRNTQPVLIHGNTPASMQILGWADRKLVVEPSELAKIANKPGFETDEKIGNLVFDLARPGAMFWNEKQGSLNILRREDMQGAPALIAVRADVQTGAHHRTHLVVTAHRLENQGALLRKITSGELKPLYLDRANPLIKQAMQTRKYRVSLQSLAPENLHARAGVKLDMASRLLSDADLVKWEQDNWGDAPKFSPARAQTETPEFKKWYEGSNLRNADGSPMVLYHGTNKDFSRFGISKTGAMGPGVYLGDDPEVANAYSGGTGANVMPVYARGRYIGNREWSSYIRDNGWEKGREKAIEDGVAGVWDQKFESAVLVFDPANIKSAIGNNGQFDSTNPDIRYSPARWYFSPLQRAFEQAPDKMFSTAPQVKAWLSSNAGKLGVKQDEIQWSGINDWLDLQGKQKISKDQVIQYLANNGVQVEEVEKGKQGYNEDDPALPEGWMLDDSDNEDFFYRVKDENGETMGYGDTFQDAIADAHSGHPEYWEGNDATQYSQYVLPGGENYRELLLTLPTPELTEAQEDELVALTMKARNGLSAEEQSRMDALKKIAKPSASGYHSSHWDEPNILAHVRMNDRTDAGGNRVLFIEELQSDWGQAGKKTGFRGDTSAVSELPAGWSYKDINGRVYLVSPSGREEGARRSAEGEGASATAVKIYNALYAEDVRETKPPKAPFVTDTKAWVSLAVKRIMAYAVESGYDKVAFVNGEQSAERYDLSKKIESIGYDPKAKRLEAYDKNRSQVIDKTVTEDQLEDYIGKEVAKRLLEQPLVMGKHLLDGEEIKVGGEGMKAFYDKIVPQTVSDVLKRVGGGKMETVEIDNGKAFSPEVGEVNDIMQQTGFSITPAMREQVSRGLPLFSLARKVSDAVDSTLGKLDAAVDGLSNLPDQFDYLRDRYLALGKIARVDEISTEVRKAFDGAAPADKQAVYDYLTTRGATTGRISDHKLRSIAKRIKDTINYTGDQLVARGLLDQEARDHYRDQYLPRMYLRHMLDDQAFKVIGMGKKPSDMGYLKHRKDIPQEIRDVVLGEIKDPSFLSVNAIGRAMRDVSLLDWMGKISQNNDWVFPEVFVPWQGKKVTAYWLRAEADRIENQSAHYTPANKTKADALVAQMRSTAHQALGSMSAIDHKKFKQIPDTRRYGLLRGMWVRTEIYNDIMGASQIVNADPTWFEDWFGFGGKGTRLTQWWKFTKVAANPPGQIRNFISNMVMLQLSGIGLHRLPFALIEAARDITNNGKYWQVAKKYGVTESTFTAQELFRVKRDLVEMEAQKGKLSSLRWLMSAGARFFEGVSDLYQFSEALGKTIKIMEEMKAGKSEAEAAIEAQKWLFDYSLVPQSVRIARNAPVGMPFLTYQVKVLPRLLEVAAKHPWRFLPWAGLLYGMQAAVASMFGVDDDELKKLKKSLPEWLQDRGHTVFLPFRDADGRLQVADVGYFFPWTFYSQTGKHVADGKVKKALVDDVGGQFSAPILGAAAALMANYDTFTKQPIYKETDPVGYQAAAIANYAYDLMAPPFISSHGVVSPMGLVDTKFGGKLTQALAGTTNRFGDPKATEEQALGAMLGFNFYGMDPEHTRVTNLKVMEFKVHEAEKGLKQRLMDKGLSSEQRLEAIRDYRERMSELQQEMLEYAKESQVPEQLKAKKR